MTARVAALALLLAMSGCSGAPVAVDTTEREPVHTEREPVQCETLRSPARFLFACGGARLDPALGDNAANVARIVALIWRRPEVRRVIFAGTISASAELERGHLELAAQRARSVAEAVAREGVPSAMIGVLDEPDPFTAAYNEPDPCPPAAEDSHGDFRRAVVINLVVCDPLTPAGNERESAQKLADRIFASGVMPAQKE